MNRVNNKLLMLRAHQALIQLRAKRNRDDIKAEDQRHRDGAVHNDSMANVGCNFDTYI